MRYARHVLLPEIGASGQARLEAATVGVALDDPRASAVAADYLARAGVRVAADVAPSTSPPEVRPGRPELAEAAAFLTGALHAVEAIKAVVGAGAPIGDVHVSLTGPPPEDA